MALKLTSSSGCCRQWTWLRAVSLFSSYDPFEVTSKAIHKEESHSFLVRRFLTLDALSSSAAGDGAEDGRHPFGIAFDIDGVLLRGKEPIPGARQALARLHHSDTRLARVPHVYLTNGGGVTEAAKAAELSRLLEVPVEEDQVLLGHTPFRALVKIYGPRRVLALGKYAPAEVMHHYGFRGAVSMEDYAALFPHIDPLAPHKPWPGRSASSDLPPESPSEQEPVAAVFVLSDPVDWSRDLQVLCDVLRWGGSPGTAPGPQPPLYFAADDLEYQAQFSEPRFGMGAFRTALQALYERLTGRDLEYTVVGKPLLSAFQTAEQALLRAAQKTLPSGSLWPNQEPPAVANATSAGSSLSTAPSPHSRPATQKPPFQRLYMIGDNPATDIQGARQAGPHWLSILTRTGVHRHEGNHPMFPAHKIVDNVEEAIHYIAEREGCL